MRDEQLALDEQGFYTVVVSDAANRPVNATPASGFAWLPWGAYPDGLLKILGNREPNAALYVGDNIDDALAARDAKVPFMAILPVDASGYRSRAAQFRELGALALLRGIKDLSDWLL